MKTPALLMLIITLAARPAFAEGPLAASAARAGQRAAATSASGETRTLLWTGIGLIGAGVTLSILGNTTLRHEDCIVATTFFVCTEDRNTAVWVTGVALSAVGGVLTAVGLRKDVAVGLGSVSYRLRW